MELTLLAKLLLAALALVPPIALCAMVAWARQSDGTVNRGGNAAKVALLALRVVLLFAGVLVVLLFASLTAFNVWLSYSGAEPRLDWPRVEFFLVCTLATTLAFAALVRQARAQAKIDRVAAAFVIAGTCLTLSPFVSKYFAKEICLSNGRTWNVTFARCDS